MNIESTETAVFTPLPTLLPTSSATPSPPPPTPTPTHTATASPTPTATVSLYQRYQTTGQNQEPLPYLEQFRLVAFYGTPLGPALGILGLQPPAEMIQQLRETAVVYQNYPPERTTLPTFHIIVAIADTTPPYYRHHLNQDLIQEWIELAEELNFAVILDIQPGHASPLSEFNLIKEFLYNPHVHLAIDPEFTMQGSDIPGRNIGSLYANDINIIQAELEQIAQEIGINRLLILHQFAGVMLPDKGNIQDYPNVELVIDGDGVGSPEAKIRNYLRYASEPAFEYGGFKLFPTDGDFPVLTPDEVMNQLTPAPLLIIYQ